MADIFTGYKYDEIKNQTVVSFDIIDPIVQEEMQNSRINICKLCENFDTKISPSSGLNVDICKECGCGLINKTKLVYPFDTDGKSFIRVLHENKYAYVCPLKKW